MSKLSRRKKPTDENKRLFSHGFEDVYAKARKNARFIASCYNCKYYYKSKGDKEELCQNGDVLDYDMVYTPHNVFCNHWVLFDELGGNDKCQRKGLRSILVTDKKKRSLKKLTENK